MKIIGLITARGGSKGVPGKNTALVGGKPLIAWTIEAAQQARLMTRAIVSTDSEEIAAVARQWGAEVPFLRPAELAQDGTPHLPVLLHALDWMRDNEGWEADYFMVLQPTSPLRTAADVDASIALAQQKDADGVIGMAEMHGHPYWCKTLLPDGRLAPLFDAGTGSLRRQDLPSALMPNGAIYLARTPWFRQSGSFYGDKTFAYVMPPERSLDIDTAWELALARLLVQRNLHHENH